MTPGIDLHMQNTDVVITHPGADLCPTLWLPRKSALITPERFYNNHMKTSVEARRVLLHSVGFIRIVRLGVVGMRGGGYVRRFRTGSEELKYHAAQWSCSVDLPGR